MRHRLSAVALVLGLLSAVSASGLSPTTSVIVPGTSAGLRSGLYLIAGDVVRLNATGEVDTLPGTGSLATPAGNGSPCTSACLLPSAQFGALIWRIGSGPWFFVGSSLTFTAGQTGMLHLAVNDTIHDNNEGQFTVGTRVTANASFNCAPSATAMCLNNNRFSLQVFWRVFDGGTGNGQVTSCGTADSGIFWFFNSANWELMVKILDGCGLNDSFWVFAAATTNVEFTLRVRDTHTGEVKMYFNPLSQSADALTDTGAFPGC